MSINKTMELLKAIREQNDDYRESIDSYLSALDCSITTVVRDLAKAEESRVLHSIRAHELECALEEIIQERNDLIKEIIDYFEDTIDENPDPKRNRRWIKFLVNFLEG